MAAATSTGYRSLTGKSIYYKATNNSNYIEHVSGSAVVHSSVNCHYKYGYSPIMIVSSKSDVDNVVDVHDQQLRMHKFVSPAPVTHRAFHQSPQPQEGEWIMMPGTTNTNSKPSTMFDTTFVEMMKEAGKSDHDKYYRKSTNAINHREAAARYGGHFVDT